ncbi:MAG: UbiD-type (de) carboxylyase-like protein [Rhodospirillaceae bacterium]|nr:UbiD-type (de) carboxylyase-like protein [Rhodospirillaceae bacterium]
MNDTPTKSAQSRNEPIQDLRQWLEAVDDIGELVRVSEPVSRDQEMSAIGYLLAKQQPSPTVMFEKAENFDDGGIGARLLWNLAGPSLKRIAITLGEDPEMHTIELIQKVKTKLMQRIPPREISAEEAPIFENTLTGDDIDLDKLPIPIHWPLDGGRYPGTADCVITRDPDTGYLNVGTYRMMQQGKRHSGLYLSPGKDARLHIERAWERGESIEVAAAWGVDPIFMLVGSQGFPKNISEYEFIGGIRDQAVSVVKGKTTDLLIPANAEMVIEGVLKPGAMKGEGPFGEFTGYYGRPEGDAPLIEITALHHRNQPIMTNALMADYPSCEQSGFFAIIRSARVWNDFDKLGIAGIQGVYCHPAAAGGWGMTCVSIEQRYAGHAAQVLALAAQVPGGAYYTKWIVAVDEDIDPCDMDQVIWAMSTRSNPVDDVEILKNTWSTQLDPSQYPPENRPYGSKCLINACKDHKHIKEYSKRTMLSEDVYNKVVSDWDRLGLPGQPPLVRHFEKDA